jgi:putative ATP-dependent endonuclease of OLD family
MFKKLILKNFRNFEHIDIELKDKNVILGMNDVGKSNLLHALRMVFDKKIRLDEIHNTDFHNKNIAVPIEIMVSFDITESLNTDIEKLRAKAREAITFEESKNFYIKLIIKNTKEEGILKQFFWGDNVKNLKEIKSKGINFLILDDVFSVVYIPSHVETSKIFNEIRKEILKDFELSESDEDLKREIAIGFKDINSRIQNLTSVEKIEKEINDNLKFFDETYQVKVTSQSVVDDLYKQLKIYTIETGYEHLYPASGDGRQKKSCMLCYIIF